MTKKEKKAPKNKGKFSHAFYDDLTETLFLYFTNTVIQNLAKGRDEPEIRELCIWVNPKDYKKMRQYFIDHPTIENLV